MKKIKKFVTWFLTVTFGSMFPSILLFVLLFFFIDPVAERFVETFTIFEDFIGFIQLGLLMVFVYVVFVRNEQ